MTNPTEPQEKNRWDVALKSHNFYFYLFSVTCFDLWLTATAIALF